MKKKMMTTTIAAVLMAMTMAPSVSAMEIPDDFYENHARISVYACEHRDNSKANEGIHKAIAPMIDDILDKMYEYEYKTTYPYIEDEARDAIKSIVLENGKTANYENCRQAAYDLVTNDEITKELNEKNQKYGWEIIEDQMHFAAGMASENLVMYVRDMAIADKKRDAAEEVEDTKQIIYPLIEDLLKITKETGYGCITSEYLNLWDEVELRIIHEFYDPDYDPTDYGPGKSEFPPKKPTIEPKYISAASELIEEAKEVAVENKKNEAISSLEDSEPANIVTPVTEEPAAAETTFTDTGNLNDAQTNALNAAVDKGIITGYDDDTVRPFGTLTRAEFAAMLCRYMDYELTGGCTFSDAAAHWATQYIKACADKGAINGIGGNLFDPEAPVTFCQATKIVTIASGMTSGTDLEANGGYPTAYVNIGEEKNLFENLTQGNTGEDYALPRIDAVVMIGNVVDGNDTVNRNDVDTIVDKAIAFKLTDTSNEEVNIFKTELIRNYAYDVITNKKTLLEAIKEMETKITTYWQNNISTKHSYGNSIQNYRECEDALRTAVENFWKLNPELGRDKNNNYIGVSIID